MVGFVYKSLEAIEENLLGFIAGCIVVGSIGSWSYGMYSIHNQSQVEIKRIEKGLEIKVGYYNVNPILDKFYEINGEKVPVEVDNKKVSEYFK